MEFFSGLHPVMQSFLATLFTYGVTALGAAVVFFFKGANRRLMDGLMGFGAGVMIAASFFSLLSPAVEMCSRLGQSGWLVTGVGFLLGGGFILLGEVLLSRSSFLEAAAPHGSKRVGRCLLLIFAITLHNIPEGMAIGVAFGTVGAGGDLIGSALLALGIGLQNFPEGASVSLPLRREGVSRSKSFFFGQLSGLVEPVSAVVGCAAALLVQGVLPFLRAFSAGAMVTVVAAELIPEASQSHKLLAAAGVTAGFCLMMMLDVGLG